MNFNSRKCSRVGMENETKIELTAMHF